MTLRELMKKVPVTEFDKIIDKEFIIGDREGGLVNVKDIIFDDSSSKIVILPDDPELTREKARDLYFSKNKEKDEKEKVNIIVFYDKMKDALIPFLILSNMKMNLNINVFYDNQDEIEYDIVSANKRVKLILVDANSFDPHENSELLLNIDKFIFMKPEDCPSKYSSKLYQILFSLKGEDLANSVMVNQISGILSECYCKLIEKSPERKVLKGRSSEKREESVSQYDDLKKKKETKILFARNGQIINSIWREFRTEHGKDERRLTTSYNFYCGADEAISDDEDSVTEEDLDKMIKSDLDEVLDRITLSLYNYLFGSDSDKREE